MKTPTVPVTPADVVLVRAAASLAEHSPPEKRAAPLAPQGKQRHAGGRPRRELPGAVLRDLDLSDRAAAEILGCSDFTVRDRRRKLFSRARENSSVRPVLLDLYCCDGGCARGYHDAGFDVVGVDKEPQPNYPYRFVQADAIQFALACGHLFAAIDASPPCHAYTTMQNKGRNRRAAEAHPQLIGPTRDALNASGRPWIMENVLGARSEMPNAVLLTGEMFGLRVHRPRLFEASFPLVPPAKAPKQRDPVAIYGPMDGRRINTRRDGTELRVPRTVEPAREAMRCDWMEWDELTQAIPPAYTRYLGAQLMAVVLAEIRAVSQGTDTQQVPEVG